MGSFDPGLFLWSLITFAVLLAVLAKFAFKPISQLLAQREETIRKSLDEAHASRDEARELHEQGEQHLRDVREDAGRIIAEGHRIVADMKREAVARAHEESDKIVEHARTEIDREVQRSLDELKATVANLSVRISRQVIRESLDEEKHQALAEDFIERLKKSHAGSQAR